MQRVLQTTFSASTSPTTADVEDFIADASDDIEWYTGRAWGTKFEKAEYHDGVSWGPNAGVVYLDHAPVIKVTLVEFWDGSAWKTNTEEAPSGGATDTNNWTYSVYYDKGIIRFNKLQISGMKMYRVSYEWGQDVPPRVLRMACADLTALYAISSLSKGGQMQFNANGAQVRYGEGWEYGVQAKMIQDRFNRRLGRLRDYYVAVG